MRNSEYKVEFELIPIYVTVLPVLWGIHCEHFEEHLSILKNIDYIC